MPLKFIDRYESTVNSGYTSGGGSLVVATAPTDSSVFPYWIVVEAEGGNTEECFKVTTRSGTTLTVTGAQFGTAASNHASSAVVKGSIIGEASYEQMYADICGSGVDASFALNKAGNLYLPTNGIYARRDNGSIGVPWGPIFPFTEPVDGDFAWDNQGGASAVTTFGGVYLTAPATAGSSMRVRHKSAPSAPYTIDLAFIPNLFTTTTPSCGLCFRQSSDGKLVTWALSFNGTNLQFVVNKMTNATTFSAAYSSSNFALEMLAGTPVVWLRIEDDNTSRKSHWSTDGKSWKEFHSVGRTDFLTADQVGFYAEAGQATGDANLWALHWVEG